MTYTRFGSEVGPAQSASSITELWDALKAAGILDANSTAPVGTPAPSLPTSEALLGMVPTDLATWSPPSAPTDLFQLVAVDRIQAGSSTGNHVNVFGDTNLTVNAAGGLDSPFVMDDGETRILWADTAPGPFGTVNTVNGQYQFDPASTYNPPPAAFGHGEIDPTRSHRLFFDGNRIQWAYISVEQSVGPGGDPCRGVFTFQVQDWMTEPDPTTFGIDWHVPIGESGTSPLLSNIGGGIFTLRSKYSATPIPSPGNANNHTTEVTLGQFTLPATGSWVTVAIDAMIDPGASGYATAAYAVDGGASTVFTDSSIGSNFGFIYADTALNSKFYPIVQTYDFHQFPTATSPNWTGPTTRKTVWAGWYFSDPATGASHTISELMDTGRSMIGAYSSGTTPAVSGQPVAWFQHTSSSASTYVAGQKATFGTIQANNNADGDISRDATGEIITVAADTGIYQVEVWASPEDPLPGDVTTLSFLHAGGTDAELTVGEATSQSTSWMGIYFSDGGQLDFEVDRLSVTGSGRVDVKVRVERIGS